MLCDDCDDGPFKILVLQCDFQFTSAHGPEELVESAGKKAAVELGKVLAGSVPAWGLMGF